MKRFLFTITTIFLFAGMFAQTPRLSLLEEFTGENCSPCAALNPGLNITLDKPINRKRAVAIKWQVPIPSAPSATWSLYQTNKVEINWRYKSVGAGGYGYLNGAGIGSAPYILHDGWIQGGTNNEDLAAAQSYSSAFSIKMDREWDATQSSVNLTVTIQATANFTSVGNLVFRTVMVESVIQFTTAPGSNGETEFHDVGIKSFPTLQNGVPMVSSWTTGQTQTFTLNCPLPSYTRKKEQVAFVGFIQDDGNRKVAQAVRAEKQGIGLNDAETVSLSSAPGIICNNAPIAPVLVMRNNGTNTITNFTLIPYLDAMPQTPIIWAGTFTNGAYKTINFIPFTNGVSGAHFFSCKISSVSGGDSDTLNNYLSSSFFVGSNATTTQVTEGFTGAFPPVKWGVINPDEGTTWVKSTAAGGFGASAESAFYEGYFNDRGDVDEMILPPLDLSGTAVPTMTFDVAYARRLNRSDTLEVLASPDCGATWALLYQKQDSVLSTIPYAYLGTSFTPAATYWRTETLTLPGFNQQNVLVKFRVKNDAGNNIYVDNVNVSQSQPLVTNVNNILPVSNADDVTLYPNPTSNFVNVRIQADEASTATLLLLSATGQELTLKKAKLDSGTNKVEIDVQSFPPGFYQLVITLNNKSVAKKFSVIK